MKKVETSSLLEDDDWFFLGVLYSKNCKGETLHSLKYNYSLPDFLILKESVEIMDDIERAVHKDHDNKPKK